ncbi:[acyl-carrier-protein] S-malonyltransferase [Candidatus Woesebacteria bacterium RIFCSPHIGHO2_01_FULL_38_9]|uniref:Malonyl CoA-acyl carrier protein transacylase n=2 Tax=Candidatus Woeseibacteriota TaxID=1752722 RepID=A0A1F7Y0C0_9BACT|nr:MAG: [acyl-carrier-protein] S-malonyltransferase [Candidatus Woesebacteria bacterium RIFCSPHIGHO2_01_FULL_38_9]OGM63904.1 MAG: [acyl-carrier-protein] S-malonyltransferase [Candidatus Woesebacteria bacterium RIFCSPLOWO2_01_FULL_39_25]
MERTRAFVFPGQGSQKVGMSMPLLEHKNSDISGIAGLTYEEADDILQMKLKALCTEGPEEILNETRFTQPALLVTSIAALRILNSRGFKAEFVAGHSLGEYSALVAAEALSFEQALKLVKARGEFMTEAGRQNSGSMAALMDLSLDEVRSICEKTGAEVANINTENQIVIAGKSDTITYAISEAKSRKGRARELNVSIAGHSSLMEPARQNLEIFLQKEVVNDPNLKFVQNSTGNYAETGEQVRRGLVDQMTGTVHWLETIRLMNRDGVGEFIEVGPGEILSNIIKRILPQTSGRNSGLLISKFV